MIAWNDRRKAKKAASATTKAQISAMAKRGTLRAATTSPGQRIFGKAERAAVAKEVDRVNSEWGPTDNPGVTGSRADRWASATKKVDKAADVGGYDAPAYRARAEKNNAKGQSRGMLPKRKGK
jgi:hypothetical protein